MPNGNTPADDVVKVRTDLHGLALRWGYGDYADEVVRVVVKDYVISKSEYVSGKAPELAELIAFIRRTKGRQVRLSDTDEIKSSTRRMK